MQLILLGSAHLVKISLTKRGLQGFTQSLAWSPRRSDHVAKHFSSIFPIGQSKIFFEMKWFSVFLSKIIFEVSTFFYTQVYFGISFPDRQTFSFNLCALGLKANRSINS